METIEGVKVTTQNDNLDQKIEAVFDIEVPGDYAEAEEFYGSVEGVVKAIQGDVKTRKMNAVRPVLNEAESEADWNGLATQIAGDYKPGRRSGPKVSEDEVADIEDVDALKTLLRARGVL